MFGRRLCLCWCVFVDSRQGDWDLTELKSVAAQGSWSALLPDSNITQAGAFLREAWEPKVDLCVTLSASLLGWCQCCDGAAAGGESWPGQNRVQLNTRRNRSVCWCYSDDNYFVEIQFRSFSLLKKKRYVWKRLPCVNDSTSKCAFLKVCRRYSNIYKC